MLVDLVQALTADQLRLDGAIHPANPDARATRVADAALLLHGTGSNFYASTMMAALAGRLQRLGLDALLANTRGHDGISTAASPLGHRRLGAAYERIDDCRHDVAAWLDLLVERGHERIVLVGHSMGALKAIYAMAHAPHARVAALAAISPPRLAHRVFASCEWADAFAADYRRAVELVAAGQGDALVEIRFPLPYIVSAAGYVDKYGPDERYDLLSVVNRVACPLSFIFAEREMRQNPAFRGVPEQLAELNPSAPAPRDIAIIAAADHFYTAVHADLADRLEQRLRKALG